jgi:hypothetical protein
MARLDISLFDTFQVALAGQPVTQFESDKVRALLAYLAVEPTCAKPSQIYARRSATAIVSHRISTVHTRNCSLTVQVTTGWMCMNFKA